MVGKNTRRPSRINFRKPLPPPPRADNQPIPHAPKRSAIAITGTGPDRLCAICLGRLEAGTVMTICECGKFFHLSCIRDIGQCPLCNHAFDFSPSGSMEGHQGTSVKEITQGEDNTLEVVFQCPVCFSYVREDAAVCHCGAVFDSEEEIYLCPGCGCEVSKDAETCHNCGMKYE